MINIEDLVDVADANIKEDDWELYKVFKPMKVFGKHLETLFDIGIHKVWKLEDIINNLKSHVNVLSDSREDAEKAAKRLMEYKVTPVSLAEAVDTIMWMEEKDDGTVI